MFSTFKNKNNDVCVDDYKSDKQRSFFRDSLAKRDPIIEETIKEELNRQQNQIELIASENIVSKAVMEAQGSVLTNKYAEGYPNSRYYGGCEFVDKIEQLAIDRAKKLFNCEYANVQPNSGSQANQACFLALIKPGDTILGLSLSSGGHLTHGSPANQSGKWFNAISYEVSAKDYLIDYDQVERLAVENKPKLIIAGCSAYPRIIDFAKFRAIADKVGAYLMVDMAHFAGLVAAGLYPSPLPYADVVTTTTHKTLRGPRGGLILSNNLELGKKINSAIFPGIQGGPLMHVIAGKAVAFGEALTSDFKHYAEKVVDNAKILAEQLMGRGIKVITSGTDSHVVLLDLSEHDLTGKETEKSLERAGLTTNKNAVPFDQKSPFVTSGIRLGTPAGTTRGFGEEEFRIVANLIADVIYGLKANKENNKAIEEKALIEVRRLCKEFPIY